MTLHTCDAGDFLADSPSNHYDFVFLDSARTRYLSWGKDLIRVTNFGTLVIDNAVSHGAELTGFSRYIQDDGELAACVLPIGKGQMVVRRRFELDA